MSARAPAKAILSGEHAVVFGQPALALALATYADVSISPSDTYADAATRACDSCELLLSDLDQRYIIELATLDCFAERCVQRHQRFIDGDLAIDAVLPGAADLYHYALALLLQQPQAISALAGCRIELRSDIAIGSGMGSSAATVSALLMAVSGWLNTPLTTTQLTDLTTRCEMLQHGRSSGLDPAICARGGLLQFDQGVVESLPVELDQHWYLVDSGRPSCSTGRCTSQVRQQFSASEIWLEFGRVTRQLATAVTQQSSSQIRTALRTNHRLLCRIGVVPEPVQRFVDLVEQHGGGAKISGAGAVIGEAGGLLLVYYPGDPEPVFSSLLESFGYSWQAMEQDTHGAQLRD
jgi:mevalonate kinase